MEVSELERLGNDSRDANNMQQLMNQHVPKRLILFLARYVSDSADLGIDDASIEQRQALLLTLRTLRNLCAMGKPLIDQLCENDAEIAAAKMLSKLLPSQSGVDQLLKANMQLLANLASSSSGAAAGIWLLTFPAVLSDVASSHPALLELLGCLAFRCIHATDAARTAMQSPAGIHLLQSMLAHAPEDQSHVWLQQLLLEVCVIGGQLGAVLQQPRLPLATRAEALHLIQLEVEAQDEVHLTSAAAAAQLSAALMHLLRQALDAVRAADAASTATPESYAGAQYEADSSVHLLESALKVIRALSGIDPGLQSGSASDVVYHLSRAGLVEQCLGMLGALAPITPPLAGSTGSASPANGGNVQFLPPPLPSQRQQQQQTFPSTNLYRGYRSDLVAVLSNAAYGRPPVQEQISQASGVELLLQQCQIEDDNPLVKEWALWGIRNLASHDGVKQTIEQLQVSGVAPSSVLQEAGISVDLNPATMKPRIRQNAPPGGS